MSWPAFFSSLWGLCRFRRGPEDMPYAPPLLVALLVTGGALQAAFNLHGGAKPGVVVAVLVGSLGVVGAIYLLLRGRGKTARFVQTVTALAAVYLVFGVIADVLIASLGLEQLSKQVLEHPDHPPVLTAWQTLLVPAVVALVVWQVCVIVSVLRRALEIPLAGAVLVLLLLFLVNLFVANLAAGLLGVV